MRVGAANCNYKKNVSAALAYKCNVCNSNKILIIIVNI